VSKQAESKFKAANGQKPGRFLATLVVGLLLGACLGPGLFLATDRLDKMSGDILLSFSIGVFLSLGLCLALVVVAALLLLPRIFSAARGTLAGVVDDLSHASRAHARGDTERSLEHLRLAIGEGAAWYSAGATRKFAAQAALGLLISFGSTIGAVLLFTQNTLLRDQNAMIGSQLELLTEQNNKIDQQTRVSDAQKRSAFATEMFAILKDVAERVDEDGRVSDVLAMRIAVLTTSAVPYVYLDFGGDYGRPPTPIARPLSPERGQLLVALARMKVKLSTLVNAGARFDHSDLRGADLRRADLSSLELDDSDLSFAKLDGAQLKKAQLHNVVIKKAVFTNTDFTAAKVSNVEFVDSHFAIAVFDYAQFANVKFIGGAITSASFADIKHRGLAIEAVALGGERNLPKGLPWPQEIVDAFAGKGDTLMVISHEFSTYP
jgi:hypothetical protein